MKHIPLVEVTRGSIVESIHYGSLAVAFSQDNTFFTLGEDTLPIFLRSSAKPFQTLAFLERGGYEHFNLSPEKIAIISASHSGTDQHVAVLQKLHDKIGLTEEMLQCGTHIPYDRETALRILKYNESLRPYHSDCSGKHSGMLAFAKMIGAPMGDYLDINHPVQKHILHTFAEMCEVDVNDIILGIDGCSALVFAIPLPNAARGYAKLCEPHQLPDYRANACRLITQSMAAHPDLVAGPDRFDTDFMHEVNGKAISKIGAEGYLAIGVFPDGNPQNNGGIGITIKIADGDKALRAGSVVGITVLQQLGVLTVKEIIDLKSYTIRPVTNWKNDNIGEIHPTQQLLNALENIIK